MISFWRAISTCLKFEVQNPNRQSRLFATMTDRFSKAQRSANMSKIRNRDTKPELLVRSALHRLGFRYRLHQKHLPGKPDLVLPKYGTVVFVNGCFWHQHSCKDGGYPKSNKTFWKMKLDKNVERDRRNKKELISKGWRVLSVWECELTPPKIYETIRVLAKDITIGSSNAFS